MSDTTASLRRKIDSAGELQSVVRTMKAMAASSIGQYEKSVRALADYAATVELGLGACLRKNRMTPLSVQGKRSPSPKTITAVVFGSDQGLVGQFNDVVADYAVETLVGLSTQTEVWAVGERVHARLEDAGLQLRGLFNVPNSVKAITPLVGKMLLESGARSSQDEGAELHIFHNRPHAGAVYT
ncbi:MAG: F0F1 ATP synthase subunit gamma, partial [Eubacteriales bacterium]|nr:F0F1 ATP synthase subunit gamma [Eubacteriales bacterium]